MTLLRRLALASIPLMAFVGCEPTPVPPNQPSADPGPATPKKPESEAVKPAADADKKADAAKLSDAEVAEIKKLPADEQPIALAQITCPVSGEHLGEGGMGAPIKQVVDGKTFFLCCSGCEGEVKKDPAGVLAKLNKK